MRRLRREIYAAILEEFINYGPMRLTKVATRANINYVVLKSIVNELVSDGVVEERKSENNTVYAVTSKAKVVLVQLKESV
jgi:predicted transcriptional regulator